jgi:hypothetical protein
MIQQALLAQDAIDRRLRSHIESLLGKDRDDLAGCEIGKAWIVDGFQNGLAFFSTEPMGDISVRPFASITAESLRSNHQSPSPQRARCKAEQTRNGLGGGATTDAFPQQLNHDPSLFSRDQGSSSD